MFQLQIRRISARLWCVNSAHYTGTFSSPRCFGGCRRYDGDDDADDNSILTCGINFVDSDTYCDKYSEYAKIIVVSIQEQFKLIV